MMMGSQSQGPVSLGMVYPRVTGRDLGNVVSGEVLSGWVGDCQGQRLSPWQRDSSPVYPSIRFGVPAVFGRCFSRDPLNPTGPLLPDFG